MFLRSLFLALAPLPSPVSAIGCALLLLPACGSPTSESDEPAGALPPPNVLLIVADDLGWTDLAVYGSSFYETPNLDALAAAGIRFTSGYATCPVCSPSRASIQTGKYPARTGVTDWIKGRKAGTGPTPNDRWIAADTDYELQLEETTLAEVLAARGYTTFFAGKWHLGEDERYWPERQGYDYNVGGWSKGAPQRRADGPPNGYFSPYGNPRLPDGPDGEYLPDRLTDETIAFLTEHGSAPFYINLSYYLVHNPLQAKPERIAYYEQKRAERGLTEEQEMDRSGAWIAHATGGPGGYRERLVQGNPVYAAMVESLDANIGRLIDHLKATGRYDNTVILFTSDNGGLSTAEGSPTANLPLRGGKGWMYEGGIRVPFIVKNARGTHAGTTEDAPVCGADVLPTLAELLEIELPDTLDLDGVSLQPLLQRSGTLAERPLFWHYPHYSNQGGNPASAVRLGRYKLIHDLETGAYELYDLAADLGEENDLSDQRPELGRQLRQLLVAWKAENEARTMAPNPAWNGSDPVVR